MIIWLESAISRIGALVVHYGVFGSVARGVMDPNDCDLYIVNRALPRTDQWQDLRNQIIQIKTSFEHIFNLPLNVIVLNESEWGEFSDFFNDQQNT